VGEWAKCPHCSNPKAYFIEKGNRYKCANPACYKKFSVTTNTLMHASNITIKNWLLLAFVFSKKQEEDIAGICKIQSNAHPLPHVMQKKDWIFAWKYVVRENKNKHELFDQLLICLCNYGTHLEEFKKG